MNNQIETTLQGTCLEDESRQRKGSPLRRKGSRSLSPYERAALSLWNSQPKAARDLITNKERRRIADEESEAPEKSGAEPTHTSISDLSEMFVWSTCMDATNSIRSVVSDDVELPQSNEPLLEEKKTKQSCSISDDVELPQLNKPLTEERKPKRKSSKKKSRARSSPRRSESKRERTRKECGDDSNTIRGDKPSSVGCDQGVANETGLDRRSQLLNFQFRGRSFPRRSKSKKNRDTQEVNDGESNDRSDVQSDLAQGVTNETGLDTRSQLLMYQANFQVSEVSIAGLLAIPKTSGDQMLDSVTSMDETRPISNRSSY